MEDIVEELMTENENAVTDQFVKLCAYCHKPRHRARCKEMNLALGTIQRKRALGAKPLGRPRLNAGTEGDFPVTLRLSAEHLDKLLLSLPLKTKGSLVEYWLTQMQED